MSTQTSVIEDPTDWPGQCFGCSPRNPAGLQLRFQRTPDGCLAHHILDAWHCGLEGMAHGGIVSTLLDETAAWALIMHTGCLGLTTRMEVKFHDPVRIGQPLCLEAWVVSRSGRQAATRAEVRLNDGPVLASCEADWTLASPAVVARMSGLDRARRESFFRSAGPAPGGT
jgi:acyl-coenzyme A thioesterase PaaI-like protein